MKKSFDAKTLIYPTPVWLIVTYDKSGKTQCRNHSLGRSMQFQTACVANIVKRSYLYARNIVERKAFTINVPSAGQVKIADYCGMVSGKNVDKFSTSHITAVKSEKVDAPYIQEFPMILECKLLNTVEIGIHTHFIGEIIDVKVDESMLGKDGLPDILKINPILYGPEIQSYYGVGKYLGKAFAIGKDLK